MDCLNTQSPTTATQSIYYWLDGYWIKDKEEADLMDSINAFGSVHQVITLPLEADIDLEVKRLIQV
ncbi:hypothetical protein SAMN02745130_03949 [Thiothrix eikelboomii]|uniref:Uncharacterized protein n=1 Tax=Thiothrix eikelboomii TaxID=92487 RepID=A0A1T4Y5T0_9GAMM|nr:hypothetical protein [Thiothrix eikelboomii]SKA97003.1 hypothetical protein SAMN02745130_03949 [Thiothrix eikelboomii]